MAKAFLFILLLTLLLLAATRAGESDASVGDEKIKPEDKLEGVHDLTDKNFYEIVDGKKFVMVEFYAPWCVYCKIFAPKLKKLGKLLSTSARKNDVILAKMDNIKYETFVGENFKFTGVPTVLVFRPGSNKKYEEYTGEMTVKGILDFLHQELDIKKVYLNPVRDD